MTNSVDTALAILTTISNIGLAFSPVPDMLRVHKSQSTGDMVVFPLVAMWVSNHMWLAYAYATNNIFSLLIVSAVGEVMSIVYLIIYARWSKNRTYVAKATAIGLFIFVVITAYLVLVETDVIHQSNDQLGNVLGYLADASNFFLYFSPLERVKEVIVTKSSASIPVLMSAAIGLNCALWFVTGVVDNDLFIAVPNAIGTALSVTQVVLYFIYRPAHQSASSTCKAQLPVDLEMQVSSPKSPAFYPLASPLVRSKDVAE